MITYNISAEVIMGTNVLKSLNYLTKGPNERSSWNVLVGTLFSFYDKHCSQSVSPYWLQITCFRIMWFSRTLLTHWAMIVSRIISHMIWTISNVPYKTRTRKSPRNMRIFLEVPYNMTHMKLQIWIEIPVFTCVDRILVESNLLVCIGYPTCSNLVRLKTSILSHNILKSFFCFWKIENYFLFSIFL